MDLAKLQISTLMFLDSLHVFSIYEFDPGLNTIIIGAVHKFSVQDFNIDIYETEYIE